MPQKSFRPLANLFSYITDSWRVLYPISFSIILLLLAYASFTKNQQGQDFFIAVIEDVYSLSYFIKSSVALLTWSLSLWYVTRVILRLKHIDYDHKRYVLFLIKWIPRTIGVLPVLIFIYALFCVTQEVPHFRLDLFFAYIVSYILLGAAIMLFFIYRPEIARFLGIGIEDTSERFTPNRTTIEDFFGIGVNRTTIYIILIMAAIVFLLFLLPVEANIATTLAPVTVVLLGFSFYTIVIATFISLTDIRRSPQGLLVLFYILMISNFNDNSVLRSFQDKEVLKRETIEENLTKWLYKRIVPVPDSIRNDSVYTIILIAAEGGGIRAMDWTALVLQRLNSLNPHFYKHVYAISGVSGGGVGSVFYQAYYRDKLMNAFNFQDSTMADIMFSEAIGMDFLSDVTASFIFQDNLQRLIPFPVPEFNRDRKLEDAWSHAYASKLLRKTLEEPFLDIWNKDTSLKYYIPNMLINGVLAESGQKAITTNLSIREDKSHIFDDEIDVLKIQGADIPIKTAASLCSRFPLITSGGLLRRNGISGVGHIVDGGYKENTGIETMWQLMIAMRPYLQKIQDSGKVNIPVHLLFIQNSPEPKLSETDMLSPTTSLPDLSTILSGFLNSWDRRTPTFKHISDKVLNEYKLDYPYKFCNIQLKRDSVKLPLGWYLSITAKKYIAQQAQQIDLSCSVLKNLK